MKRVRFHESVTTPKEEGMPQGDVPEEFKGLTMESSRARSHRERLLDMQDRGDDPLEIRSDYEESKKSWRDMCSLEEIKSCISRGR